MGDIFSFLLGGWMVWRSVKTIEQNAQTAKEAEEKRKARPSDKELMREFRKRLEKRSK